jgi:hypothetical protein
MGFSVSHDRAESDARVCKQHRLDPFGTDVPAIRGNDKAVLAAVNAQKTVLIESAQVSGPPRPFRWFLTKIAVRDRGAIHDDLAFVQGNAKALKRAAYGVGPTLTRPIERNHGTTFGKTVTLVHGDT